MLEVGGKVTSGSCHLVSSGMVIYRWRLLVIIIINKPLVH